MIILATLLIAFIIFFFLIISPFYLGYFVYRADLQKRTKTPINDRNLKQLKDNEDSFKFLVLGDIQSNFKSLNQIVHSNGGNNISFIIQTGDLASHADEGHYSLVLHELNKSNAHPPILIVPGNHDIKGDRSLFQNYIGQKQYYFLWRRCLFIIVDNSLGPSYKIQFQWLKKILSENHHEVKHTFIFMHREPIEWEKGQPHPALDDYTPFFQLLQDFQVDYVFSGHLHGYQRLRRNGTVFISNGYNSKINSSMRMRPSCITLVEVDVDGIRDHRIPIHHSLSHRIYGWYLDASVAHFYPWLKGLSNSLFRLKD